MPQLNRSALVMYSANQMFDLVNDVSAYPQFLPGCVSSSVLEQSTQHMLAEVGVSKVGLHHSFTTRNTLEQGQRIHMELVNGPFDSLQGVWQFTPLDDKACKVELNLNFEFNNRLLAGAFAKVFSELAGNMVQAFVTRAKQVYA